MYNIKEWGYDVPDCGSLLLIQMVARVQPHKEKAKNWITLANWIKELILQVYSQGSLFHQIGVCVVLPMSLAESYDLIL